MTHASRMPFVWNPWAVPPLTGFVLVFAIALLIVSRRSPGPTYAPVAFAAGLWSLAIGLLSCCHELLVAQLLQRGAMTAILVGGVFAMRYITWFARSPRLRLLMTVSVAAFLAGS